VSDTVGGDWRTKVDWLEVANALEALERDHKREYSVNVVGSNPLDTFIYIATADPTVLKLEGLSITRLRACSVADLALAWMQKVPGFQSEQAAIYWLRAMMGDMARQIRTGEMGGNGRIVTP
jgi:hypothetical protein